MAAPGAPSLRHAKSAAAFAEDLRLDPNVFAAFYTYARKKFFLEALNFFLEVSFCFFSSSFRPFLSLSHSSPRPKSIAPFLAPFASRGRRKSSTSI